MNYEFNKTFEKQYVKIKTKVIIRALQTVIEETEKATSVYDIPNIKKLKGYKTAFRIRIGE